jgi:transketolase
VCMDAAEELQKSGIAAEVVNMSTIKPLDENTLLRSVKKTGCVVTAEEHSIQSGLGSAVGTALGEHYPAPMKRVGTPDCFGESGESDDLMRRYGLTAEKVVASAEEVIRRKKP